MAFDDNNIHELTRNIRILSQSVVKTKEKVDELQLRLVRKFGLTETWNVLYETQFLIQEISGNTNYKKSLKKLVDKEVSNQFFESIKMMDEIQKELGPSFEKIIIDEVKYGLERYETLFYEIFSDFELVNIATFTTGSDLFVMYSYRDTIEAGLYCLPDSNDKIELEEKTHNIDKKLKEMASNPKWKPIVMKIRDLNMGSPWFPKEYWWWHLDKQ